MPVADTSQNTRTIKLRGKVLGNFHNTNPFSQINGPLGTTPSGVLTEKRISDGILDLPVTTTFSLFSIIDGNKESSGSTNGFTKIDFTDLDDAFIPIPMGGMVFNFFGTNYSTNINWDSNNALIFGSAFTPHRVSISASTAKSILFGNYDRRCYNLYYTNSVSGTSSITTLIVMFYNYYTDPTPGATIYKYQIRLIKETVGAQRQFVEVSIISSPPSPGYSTNASVSYPSGVDASGNPIDSDGFRIDSTKLSPYNITNGTAFLNPCGATYSASSPGAGTSFVFSSDSTGTNWLFTNNAYVYI
jgi:hypothetical protein